MPKLLDLFCGAGGCTAGYQRAGFWVRGVDYKNQPRYVGNEFVQAEALEYLAGQIKSGEIEQFDVIHASPPCQQYSKLRFITKREYPDLLEATRNLLVATGKPYVIENVIGAPMGMSVTLCGLFFPGLRVYRHRLFESNILLLAPPHQRHCEPTLQRGFKRDWTGFVTVCGGGNVPKAISEKAMGIDWMNRDELSQAIPPAYTEFLGRQLIQAVR